MDDKTKQPIETLPVLSPGKAQSAMMSPVQAQIEEATRARPGQPTKRTPEIVETILDRIANGRSLMSVCSAEDMPGYSTFNRWCRDDPALLEQVDIAYEFHARALDDMADDMLANGVGSTGDFNRDKERAAHLRWRLGKINRRRFGDKVQMDVVQHQPVILDLNTIEGEGGDGV